MALDASDIQIRFNDSVAAWRLGGILRYRDPRSSLALYDEAIGVLRPMSGKRFSRDIPLIGTLAESTLTLRVLGRDSASKPRLQGAAGICGTYREAAVVNETCSEFTSRAEAGLALAQGRPREAVAAHQEWLKLTENEKGMEPVKVDIYSAYVLTRRYRLLREALLAARMKAEADQTDVKRRTVAEFWKGKLSGANDAELFLLR